MAGLGDHHPESTLGNSGRMLAAAQNYTDVAAQNCTLDDFVAARRGA